MATILIGFLECSDKGKDLGLFELGVADQGRQLHPGEQVAVSLNLAEFSKSVQHQPRRRSRTVHESE